MSCSRRDCDEGPCQPNWLSQRQRLRMMNRQMLNHRVSNACARRSAKGRSAKGGEPRPLCRLPAGRGRHRTANVPRDFAAHRGATAAATTSAGVRRSMSCIQEQPTEGVRPNARENGQIRPSRRRQKWSKLTLKDSTSRFLRAPLIFSAKLISLRLYAVDIWQDPPQSWGPGRGVYLGKGLVLTAAQCRRRSRSHQAERAHRWHGPTREGQSGKAMSSEWI
jgi:hypothetical protein